VAIQFEKGPLRAFSSLVEVERGALVEVKRSVLVEVERRDEQRERLRFLDGLAKRQEF